MAVNWLDAGVAAGLIFGLLKLEQVYHIWRFNQQRRNRPAPEPPKAIAGIVSGAAEPIACHRCGSWVSKYAEYTDRSKFCLICHESGAK
jgi:hypothetical protein